MSMAEPGYAQFRIMPTQIRTAGPVRNSLDMEIRLLACSSGQTIIS
jgi:hypothetical protein